VSVQLMGTPPHREEYMARKQLPLDLQRKVRSFCSAEYERYKGQVSEENKMLEKLPRFLSAPLN
jgi:hypothetical protein